MSYLKNNPTPRTANQGDLLPGQVRNSDGGAVWPVDDMQRTRRFLVLGSQGGNYYTNEKNLTKENTDAVQRAIDANGPAVVALLTQISIDGVAIKNDPAIYVLAMCACAKDEATRRAAYAAIPKVCRIGTHLMQFATFMELRGRTLASGKGFQRGLQRWYTSKNPNDLAYQLLKYAQREGWKQTDLLRAIHPPAPTPEHRDLYSYLSGNEDHHNVPDEKYGFDRVVTKRTRGFVPNIAWVEAYDRLKHAASPKESATIIAETGAPREFVQTEHLNSLEVWEALLTNMPLTALVRNLGKMTEIGLLTPTSAATQLVRQKLAGAESIRKSRIHPFTLLLAHSTYSGGRGFRSSKTWVPIAQVSDALDGAFYLAYKNVETTNLRWHLALDVSSSMTTAYIQGTNVSACMAAAAMSLVTANSEPMYEITGFCHEMKILGLSPRMRLDQAMRVAQDNFGSTDPSLPILWALKNKREVDVFVIYTDSELNHYGGYGYSSPGYGRYGHQNASPQPVVALADYRQKTGIDAKLICVGMTSNGFTIADPDDAGMMDVVGFDSSAPAMMAEFAKGLI